MCTINISAHTKKVCKVIDNPRKFNNSMEVYIYIYIYREREREREIDNKVIQVEGEIK